MYEKINFFFFLKLISLQERKKKGLSLVKRKQREERKKEYREFLWGCPWGDQSWD